MSLPHCKIIQGKAFNIRENKETPLTVFVYNWTALEELRTQILVEYPRVCFVGSSCMYPARDGALREEMLGTGSVYEGNALYAYMKLLGWQICKAASNQMGFQYFTVIPADIFGEKDSTHFIAQIMKKFHVAKLNREAKVTFMGTGSAIRHPLFIEDYQDAIGYLCDTYTGTEPVNIAPPVSYAKSVSSIVSDIRDVVGYDGAIEWDASFADGQAVKILDNSRLVSLGYTHFTPFKESLEKAYNEIKNNV